MSAAKLRQLEGGVDDLVGSAEGRRELAPKVVAVPVHLVKV